MATPLHTRALRGARLFAGAGDELIERLAQATTRRSLRRGEHLWRAGDEATSFHVITSGLVKICRPEGPGPATILGLFGPRESVGDVAVLSQGAYPADAIVASDQAEALRIDRNTVLAAMGHAPALSASIHRSVVQHTQILHQKIQVLSAGPVERRLATLLLHLAERFGDEMEGGEVVVPVALSRTELANLVGTTMETTIRTMSRWQRSGLVETNDDGFVVRRPAELGAIAAGLEPPPASEGSPPSRPDPS